MALDGLARWLRRSGTGRAVAARLGAFYIRLVRRTTRWRFEGREAYDRLVADGTGVIIVMWHGRLFMAPYCADPRRRFAAMISDNQDGELIAALFARFGIHAVRGSTYDREKRRDKGGRRAYATALRELGRRGAVVGITPDGPRGPRMRAQPGASVLSIATGAVIQPVGFSTSRGRLLGSWDRFLLPWPFGRGAMIWGEPLRPPAGDDAAAAGRYLQEIESALTAVTERADRLCGRAPVPPDQGGGAPWPGPAGEWAGGPPEGQPEDRKHGVPESQIEGRREGRREGRTEGPSDDLKEKLTAPGEAPNAAPLQVQGAARGKTQAPFAEPSAGPSDRPSPAPSRGPSRPSARPPSGGPARAPSPA